MQKLVVGQEVPPLVLKDIDGKRVTVKSKTGKLLIINMWATWCGPCRHELPSLDRLAKILGADQATIIGISSDTDSHVLREYLIERKVDFTSYWDSDMRITNEVVGVRVFPSTLFIGPGGVLLKVVEGWREWDKADIVDDIKSVTNPGSTNKQPEFKRSEVVPL